MPPLTRKRYRTRCLCPCPCPFGTPRRHAFCSGVGSHMRPHPAQYQTHCCGSAGPVRLVSRQSTRRRGQWGQISGWSTVSSRSGYRASVAPPRGRCRPHPPRPPTRVTATRVRRRADRTFRKCRTAATGATQQASQVRTSVADKEMVTHPPRDRPQAGRESGPGTATGAARPCRPHRTLRRPRPPPPAPEESPRRSGHTPRRASRHVRPSRTAFGQGRRPALHTAQATVWPRNKRYNTSGPATRSPAVTAPAPARAQRTWGIRRREVAARCPARRAEPLRPARAGRERPPRDSPRTP
ncbi:hypothetical protein GA0115244_100313 [Streptomyces sp. DvalAA-19]|nr:hypothetical protein GA0115244_100313 [Streptomyces sp. DvalAA-19]